MRKIIGVTVGTTLNPQKIAPDLGSLLIQETENGEVILTTKDNKTLFISPHYLNIAPYNFSFDNSQPASGLKVETPTKESHCANKGYVDGLVGDIDAALDNILAIQNALISQSVNLAKDGD